jgi:hypothetical protein
MRLYPLLVAAAALVSLAGCGSDARSSASPAAGKPVVFVPGIAPKAGTDFKQVAGDTLAVLAVEPSKLTVTQEKSDARATGIGSSIADKTKYNVTTKDVATFEPDHLEILLSLKNTAKPAMDYSGIKLEYLINGKPVSFYQSNKGLGAGDVPKDGTTFFHLSGPKIADLKEGDTVHIAAHGVPSKAAASSKAKNADATDLVWDGTISADKKVELKTVTTSEWR